MSQDRNSDIRKAIRIAVDYWPTTIPLGSVEGSTGPRARASRPTTKPERTELRGSGWQSTSGGWWEYRPNGTPSGAAALADAMRTIHGRAGNGCNPTPIHGGWEYRGVVLHRERDWTTDRPIGYSWIHNGSVGSSDTMPGAVRAIDLHLDGPDK